MSIRTLTGVWCILAIAIPALAAPATTGGAFIAKAGAGDLWERREAAIMTTSTNGDIVAFARRMMLDHTKSTEILEAAARADGIAAAPAMMSAKQEADLAALTASKGAARDSMYLTQQKAAHAEALALMEAYASDGKATHLKDAAGRIVPIVQSHVDMLNGMAI